MQDPNKLISALLLITISALVAINPFKYHEGDLFFVPQGSWASTELDEIFPSDTDGSEDEFGRAIEIDGDYAIVGSLRAGVGGQAYIFERTAIVSSS